MFLALVVGVGGALLACTLLIRLCLATIAVALEGVGPLVAIRRSWHLTGDNTWRTLAVLILLAFILTVATGLLANLLGVVVSDTIGAQLGIAATLDAAIATGLSILFAPVPVVDPDRALLRPASTPRWLGPAARGVGRGRADPG